MNFEVVGVQVDDGLIGMEEMQSGQIGLVENATQSQYPASKEYIGSYVLCFNSGDGLKVISLADCEGQWGLGDGDLNHYRIRLLEPGEEIVLRGK
jgi:hypothetical protein